MLLNKFTKDLPNLHHDSDIRISTTTTFQKHQNFEINTILYPLGLIIILISFLFKYSIYHIIYWSALYRHKNKSIAIRHTHSWGCRFSWATKWRETLHYIFNWYHPTSIIIIAVMYHRFSVMTCAPYKRKEDENSQRRRVYMLLMTIKKALY